MLLGDSIDSISELLSLNMPRGSLLGNTNPLGTTTFNVTPSIEANSSYQVKLRKHITDINNK